MIVSVGTNRIGWGDPGLGFPHLSHHNPKMNREKRKNEASGFFTTQRGQVPVWGESRYQRPVICILLQCHLPLFLLPFWNLKHIYDIQSVIKTPSLAHSSIRVAVTWKTWNLKYFKTQITLNLRLHFFAMSQPPSGCGTVQMKPQEHKMISHSHLCWAGSPEDQRECQLPKPGNCKFPNNFQLVFKYLLSIETEFYFKSFWLWYRSFDSWKQLPEKGSNEKKKKNNSWCVKRSSTTKWWICIGITSWDELYLAQLLLVRVYKIIYSNPLVITYMF